MKAAVLKKTPIKKKERKTNQYGVNQYTGPDPRQALFFQLYFNRESSTFGNMSQSGIAAGFDEIYSANIAVQKPKWFYRFLEKQNFVNLAEAHLNEVLMLDNVTQAMGAFGPIFKTEVQREEIGVFKTGKKKGEKKYRSKKVKVPVLVPNVSIIKEKTAVAKFILPAHKPDIYKVKEGNKNLFIFNVKAARERYNGNKDVRIPSNN